MKLKYAIKAFFRLDIKRSLKDVTRVAKKSGKPQVVIFFDMLWCAVKYGAGPLDYDLFELYSKTAAQRKTYVTRGINNSLVKKLNNREFWRYFDNKNEFNEKFAEFVKRDWLFTADMTFEQFENFFQGKNRFIYKPQNDCCGHGVEMVSLADKTANEAYEYIKAKPIGIIEEVIVQHPEMSRIYPHSINTIRIVTIYKDGICTPVFSFWRIGNSGKCVDNLNSNGVAALLNIEDGSVTLPAADKDGKRYEYHPYTNEKIVGFKIPMWDKVLETADKASRIVPEVGYVAWDIAVCPDTTQLVEGNSYPGHDILQLPAYTPDNIGLKEKIEKFL